MPYGVAPEIMIITSRERTSGTLHGFSVLRTGEREGSRHLCVMDVQINLLREEGWAMALLFGFNQSWTVEPCFDPCTLDLILDMPATGRVC